jgi:predicted DNA-binding antitoxin AbrB/MazE fold protein
MPQIFEAIYEKGVLRPAAPLIGLAEGQHVWIVMNEAQAIAERAQKETELVRRLEAQGLVDRPTAPPAPVGFRPLEMPGPGLSDTILAERR